jgi:hypothetical protein
VALALIVLALGAVFAFRGAVGSTWVGLTGEWYSPACLVDANGDGALDIAGMGAAPGSEIWQLRLVDGATGRLLWSGESFKPQANLVCFSPRFFAVDNTDFHLHLYPAACPDRSVVVTLRDRVDQVGLGDGCIALRLADDQEQAFSFTGAALDRCQAGPLLKDRGLRGSFYGDGLKTQIAEDGSTYAVAQRDRGTHFLLVRRSKGDQVLWSRELPYVGAADQNFGLVLTPDTEILWGANPAEKEYALIIGLDPQTGNERFARRQSSHWSSNALYSMVYNGRYVIVGWGFGLHAYDPRTGERMWHLGGR